MAQRIFCETRSGFVEHTSVSRLLTENSKVRDHYGSKCQEVWPAATRCVDALELWPGSREKCESGYVVAYGRTLQATLETSSLKRFRWENSRGVFTDERGFGVKHVVKGFDWAALGKAKVVDVGGGVGTASKALARAFHLLEFVVQDQPDVIASATVEHEEAERITFLAHDFFTLQPVKNADVYFFRRVFMEWTDEKAVGILQALKPALKVGSRVLIQDVWALEPGSCTLWQERRFRASDMAALAIANGGQRDLEDWKSLFEQAGPGFEYQGVKPVPDSDVVFIEATWRGEECRDVPTSPQPFRNEYRASERSLRRIHTGFRDQPEEMDDFRSSSL